MTNESTSSLKMTRVLNCRRRSLSVFFQDVAKIGGREGGWFGFWWIQVKVAVDDNSVDVRVDGIEVSDST